MDFKQIILSLSIFLMDRIQAKAIFLMFYIVAIVSCVRHVILNNKSTYTRRRIQRGGTRKQHTIKTIVGRRPTSRHQCDHRTPPVLTTAKTTHTQTSPRNQPNQKKNKNKRELKIMNVNCGSLV